jgi:hypothetical protein
MDKWAWFRTATQEQLVKEADCWSDQYDIGDQERPVASSKMVWEFVEQYPLSLVTGTVEDWQKWFSEEQEMVVEDGREGYYDDIIEKPIHQPVVLCEIEGTAHIWDGNHRVGGSHAVGRLSIPAIVGRLA